MKKLLSIGVFLFGLLGLAGFSSAQSITNTGIIGGKYHFDYNNNKIYDTGDSGVDGVNIYLYEYRSNRPAPQLPLQLVQTKKTDYYGNYIFTGLSSTGTYQVRFGIMSGFDFTNIYDQFGNTGEPYLGMNPTTINNILNFYNNNYGLMSSPIQNSPLNHNAGIIKSNTNIYGRYHFDYNANSKYDTGDSGVEGGNIFIYNCDNNSLVKQVRTDYYGNYAITGLAIGNYKVSAGIINTFSKVYSSGMDTCQFFDTNKSYYNYNMGIRKINNTQNGGTYTPSTTLYTDHPASGANNATGTQIINTQYGNVQKTITSTGTVIKLLDLNIYVDRSKPAQNEFPDIKAVQEKYTKAMPHVGADMNDAYILAVSSLETAKI